MSSMDYSATVTLTAAGLATLATSMGFCTSVVDNSTTKYLDVLVWIKARTSGSATPNGIMNIYAVCRGAGMDTNSISYSCSIAAPVRNLNLAEVMAMGTTATGSATSIIGPISLATAFGGLMPPQWAILVENLSGAALATSADANIIVYQGVKVV